MEYRVSKSGPRFKMPRPPKNYLPPRPFGPWQNTHLQPHLLSESLLLPSSEQPPPMSGPRGATVPPRFYRPHNQRSDDTQNYHWCETCDRGFRTQIILEDHKKEHQKCNIDGCQFIAHPKVITKHIQMQHSSGLYNKISKLSNPQEIEKWREERRKKFPTKANIDQKKAEREEKVERGERMNLKQKKFPGINRNTDNNRIHSFGNKKKGGIARRKPKKNEKECPTSLAKHNLCPFSGINGIFFESEKEDVDNGTVLDIVDEDFSAETENQVQTNNNSVCGAITQLIADYGSSDDDDAPVSICSDKKGKTAGSTSDMSKIQFDKTCTTSSANHESPIKVANSCRPEQKTIKVIEKDDCEENDSGPEEIKTIKVTEKQNLDSPFLPAGAQASKTRKNASNPRTSKATRSSQFLKRKLPSTLLEKLLSNDIRHERNVILQCVRYIIKQRYFDKFDKI